MSTEQLDALIIRNIADLDATARRIGAIEARIFSEIGEKVENWANEQGWLSGPDPDEIWCAPPEWKNDEDYDAWFGFARGGTGARKGGQEDGLYELTRLLGVGPGFYGFRLEQRLLGKRDWKVLLYKQAENLQAHGFIIENSGSAFMDVRIDAGLLAEGLEGDDLADALRPISDALDRLKGAEGLVNSLLSHAKDRAQNA